MAEPQQKLSEVKSTRLETDPQEQIRLARIGETFQSYRQRKEVSFGRSQVGEKEKVPHPYFGSATNAINLIPGLDLQALQDLDQKAAKEALADVERAREAHRSAPKSDLSLFRTASAARLDSEHTTLLTPVGGTSSILHTLSGAPSDSFYEFVVTKEYKPFAIRAEGHNSGWNYLFGDEEERTDGVIFEFKYTPPTTTYYTFKTFLYYNGYYILRSDDGLFTSKEVQLNISDNVFISQPIPGQTSTRYYNSQDFLSRYGDNINQNNNISDLDWIQASALLYGGIEANFFIQTFVTVRAKGGGSVCEVNCANPGDGIGCPWVEISVG